MLKTEMRNENTTHIDKMTTAEMVAAIQRENLNAVKAIDGELEAISAAIPRSVRYTSAGSWSGLSDKERRA